MLFYQGDGYLWHIVVWTGAQWLSGRVLDSRLKGRGFEPHRRHCVVSLSKNINPSLVLVQPRKTCPFITERLLMGRKESNQTKKKTKIVVWTIYTSHIDHFTPRHTVFEQSIACLSVFLESLPGLIPFTILWHAGWTLEKPVAWTWTTIIRLQYLEVFLPKMYKFLVEKFIFTVFAYELFKVKMKNCK